MINFKTFVRQAVARMGYEVYVIRDNGMDYEILQGDDFVKVERGVVEKPTYYLHHEVAQEIVDQLSKQGVKTQQGYLEGKI